MKKYFKSIMTLLTTVLLFCLFSCKMSDSNTNSGNKHNDNTNTGTYECDSEGHWHDGIKEAHSFGEWTIIIAPTTSELGQKERQCSVCGYIETSELPKNIIIVWVDVDGNTLDSTEVEGGSTGDSKYEGIEPTKPSNSTYYYIFDGWQISVSDDGIIIYIPKFKENYIEYKANFYDSDGNLIESISYHYGENYEKPTAPLKDGYEFVGWKLDSYGGTGGANGYYADFIATYKEKIVETYTVKFVDYNDEVLFEGVYEYGKLPEEPEKPTRENDDKYSYEFIGWDKEIEEVTKNTTYKACYKEISLFNTIIFDKNGGYGGSDSVSAYFGKDLEEALAPIKDGYEFLGYFDELGKMYYNASMEGQFEYDLESDITLYAKWEAKTYTVTLDPLSYTYSYETIHTVTYNESYDFKTVEVESKYVFKGWQYEGEIITNTLGRIDNWNIDSDVTLTPVVEALYTYTDSSKTSLYFGSYPQTLETNTKIINKLNGMYGSLPSKDNDKWTDYGYYLDGTIQSYMYYIDIDIDNDNVNDYRGVYFTSYRPINNLDNSTNSYQDDNGYLTKTVYWFKYEKIKWNILKTEDNKAMLICDLVLDSQNYYDSKDTRYLNEDTTIYANNYKYSHIRSWLNDTFYNTSFSAYEKSIIEITNISNSADTTTSPTNQYACENTNDKVFLLSYKEIFNYYPGFEGSTTTGTDYALIQGLQSKTQAMYWLRSPYYNDDTQVDIIDEEGYQDDALVCSTSNGVRACIWINL